MNTWLAVFLGGGLGSVLRFGVSRVVLLLAPRAVFPLATLVSNLLATALLAFVVLRMNDQLPGLDPLKAFVVVGICGGFSTFSTFSYENFRLIRDQHYGLAIANILISVVAGIAVLHLIARTP